MIAVVEGDSEFLDTKSNTVVDNRWEARVSSDCADSPDEEQAQAIASVSGMESGAVARVLEDRGSAKEVKAEVFTGAENDVEEESRLFEEKNDRNPSFVQFNARNDRFDRQNDDIGAKNDDQIEHTVSRGDLKVEAYTSLLSEFDDFVANEKHGAMAGTSRALSYGFEVGDMVWGKVKSHPWWPGHIYNEAFASSSVRRTRREGYVLVAFFGDSSYGWFDPAELVAFDPHFAEKSQQTNSRNFIKAVEEAVDETSRRCGLGLSCRCRNRYNFRPTDVEGYFEVDVPDYEPRAVYSMNQINKARGGFQPGETLAFLKQLALAPQGCDRSTIHFIKNKATVFAFRKTFFEEFDETYAQAFGAQPKQPANHPANASYQPVKDPIRAPLSGPLVIAEALGSGKSFKKPAKVKDHSKKDRYLIKRREEPVDSRTIQLGQRQAGSSASAYEEGSSAVVTGDYVLQKRDSTPVSSKHEHAGIMSNEVAGPSEDVFGKAAVISDQGSNYLGAQATHGNILDANSLPDKVKDVLQETNEKIGSVVSVDTNMGQSDISLRGMPLGVRDGASPSFQQEGEAMFDVKNEVCAKIDVKNEECAKVCRLHEGSPQTESLSGDSGLGKLQDAQPGSHLAPFDATESTGMTVDGRVKKAKVLKRSLGDFSKNSNIKKKKKKESGPQTSADHSKKCFMVGTGGSLTGKSTSVASEEDPQVNHQKKDVGTSNAFNSVGTLLGNTELELPHLLSDLHALALNPFHGTERISPSIAIRFFLQFRSRVYEKSLVSLPSSDTEPTETRATKSPSSFGVFDSSAGGNIKDMAPSKPVKSLGRPDDPTKGGRKRLPSDRQEEIAAKRLKRINMLKSLAAEKKAGHKTSESHRIEGKEPAAAAPPKPIKSDSIKKMVPHPRAVEPTMLVLKFPPQTSLPSAAELKARFARFGSIDQSAIRVFWQSSTCRVVFRHKLDAQAAYKHAVGNNSLFGNVCVRYSLREVGAPASEASESDRSRGDDVSIEAPRIKDPANERPPLMHQAFHPQSTVQLKSILKKPTGDEVGQVTGGRGTARVKFMLSGEETIRGEQMMVGNRNFNNNASFADGGAPTSVAMDFNSKNFQKVIPPSSSPPIFPLPTQFAKVPVNNSHHTEVVAPPRNLHNLNIPVAPPSIDISQQMLSLLTRCNDVVTTVTGLLGYVPYHPL